MPGPALRDGDGVWGLDARAPTPALFCGESEAACIASGDEVLGAVARQELRQLLFRRLCVDGHEDERHRREAS